jgi:hypothetical protein
VSLLDFFLIMVFNAIFSNISAISWRPVLVVKEAEYPERTTDHEQATGQLYHLRLRVECTLFVISKAMRQPTPYW